MKWLLVAVILFDERATTYEHIFNNKSECEIAGKFLEAKKQTWFREATKTKCIEVKDEH